MPIIKTPPGKDAMAHTTEQEIKFIEKLGCYTGFFRAAELRNNYIAACDKRENWGEMNAKQVKQAAVSRLNTIRAAA